MKRKMDCPGGHFVPGFRGNDEEDGRGNENGGCEAPPWVAHFFAGLLVIGSVAQAVDESGIDFDTAWALRRAEPLFAHYWDRALRAHRAVMAGVPYWEAVGEEGAVH